MCPYFTEDSVSLNQHLIRSHRHTPKFIVHCNAHGCGASYKNYKSFKQHCMRHHRFSELQDNNEPDIVADHDTDNIANDSHSDIRSLSKIREGAFLLKLTSCHKLSKAAVNDVVLMVQDMFQFQMQTIKDNIKSALNVTDDSITDCFPNNVFTGLESDYMREKFFEDEIGLIKPQSIKLGERMVNKTVKGVTKLCYKEALGYFVPFIPQLTALLNMPEMKELLHLNMQINNDNYIDDVMGGVYCQTHQFLLKHPISLLFSLNTDDVEIVNAIGSHRAVHRVTVFYWTLLNVPAQYRSELSFIQLLCMAKSRDVHEFGADKLLQDFVTSMKLLSDGCDLSVMGETKRCHGLLVFVAADTLAAQGIGGFKEGVGGAQKPCRTCEITSAQLSAMHCHSDVIIRDVDEHNDRVQALSSLSHTARKYWSKQWGVNGKSVLSSIPHFKLTECLLHEPMQILFEGIFRLELRCMIRVFIKEKKYFDLYYLNHVIKNFEFAGTNKLDKLQPIDSKALDSNNRSLTQSAALMIVLITNLPALIGDKVANDDEHWENCLRLLNKTLLVMSPIVFVDTYNTLVCNISRYRIRFAELYPTTLCTPKLHYLIHLPEQLRKFGPLRHQWCMRYESKNGFFKSKRWFCFKNIL